MKVAGYFRESSADTTKAPSIEEQIEHYRYWVKQNNHESIGEYPDDGYSGGDWNRPNWNQCVKDARRHVFQCLWVWNQDRIARDTEQFLWFNRNLKNAHVQIWEQTSNSFVDTDTLGNKIKHTTLAQANEIFRLVTSDKVKAAFALKKAKGERWGRKPLDVPVILIEQLRASGAGYRAIANDLQQQGINVSYQTVRRVLLNRVNK